MKSRILFKDIPNSKFHSAVLTTYSFNFYYFEQQVLKLLGSKGIHYISVLVDGNILDAQFNTLSLLSEDRKRNYAINGIQSKGAFHPKINFFVGVDSVLLIIGSGNLTSSGHGKNLETWNCVYIDSKEDERLGLIKQCWVYLVNLHKNLGESAKEKLRVIEENCTLLSRLDEIPTKTSYPINEGGTISFLGSNTEGSLMSQLTAILKDDTISRITVMSPYYDIKGSFIHQLNDVFNPKKINVILQNGFGVVPSSMIPSSNIHFYDWQDVDEEKRKQSFFHAKNLVFEGRNKNYLLTGSANASIAAFGNESIPSLNQEACILYQEAGVDYLEKIGISLKVKTSKLSEFENEGYLENSEDSSGERLVFIETIEQNHGSIKVYYSIKHDLGESLLCLYNTKGEIVCEERVVLKATQRFILINIKAKIHPLYGAILDFSKNRILSNKQFVIDIYAFDATNPSPQNRSLSQMRKMIEGGDFNSLRIIEYFNTIYKSENTKYTNVNGFSKRDNSVDSEEAKEVKEIVHLTYEEVQERIKNFGNTTKAKTYLEYKSIRLWDSMLLYLKERKQKEEESRIDEEETEDINNPSRKKKTAPPKSKEVIDVKKFENQRRKITAFFDSYLNILDSKVYDEKTDKLSLIDISMYLIVMEILLHLFSHEETIKEDNKKAHLLPLSFYSNEPNWSQYTLKIIGKFTLWYLRRGGYQDIENEQYKSKISLYESMIYKVSISAIVLFACQNKKNFRGRTDFEKNLRFETITKWRNLALLNIDLFNPISTRMPINDEMLSEFIPTESIENIGLGNITHELKSINSFFLSFNTDQSNLLFNNYYRHKKDGYTYILKNIPNNKGLPVQYLKLENIGYNWEEEIKGFWDGELHDIKNEKWVKSKTSLDK